MKQKDYRYILTPLADGKRSARDISALTGMSIKYVHKLMLRYNLPRLKRGDSAKMEKGFQNYFWKGGKIVDKHGYILLKNNQHPYCNSGGYVREHRLVMELHLDRYLDPKEVVHHKNKIKNDNRIENLEIFETNGIHLKAELTGHCPKWTLEGRERILRAVRLPRGQKAVSIPD